jgi:hypothetical protein
MNTETKLLKKEKFKLYKSYIKELAKNKINLQFPNSSPKHAIPVIKNILKYSTHVHIHDPNMIDEKLYLNKKIVKEIKKFITNKQLTITTNKETTLITLLKLLNNPNIIININNNINNNNDNDIFIKGNNSIRKVNFIKGTTCIDRQYVATTNFNIN